MSNDAKFWNFIARSYLQHFGNTNPTLQQFEDMIELLSKVWLRRDLVLSPKLTDREKECLHHAALGRGVKETAKWMGITEITVNTYRQSIFEKLDCTNMAEAVAKGIRYGLLPEIYGPIAAQKTADDEQGGNTSCN